MTREEFLKAINEYNIKVSALHNLYFKDLENPIGLYDCKCDYENVLHFVVQSDKTHINTYDDLCKFFKKKQIEYKQSLIKTKLKELGSDFEWVYNE